MSFTSRRSLAIAPLAVLWLFGVTSRGAADDPPHDPGPCSFCSALDTKDPQEAIITIDARNGAFHGEHRFKKREKVKIILTNKNPYLFQYKLSVTPTPVKETAVAGFVGLLGTFLQGQLPAEKSKPQSTEVAMSEQETGAVDRGEERPGPCPQQAAAQALEDKIESLRQEILDILMDVRSLETSADAAAAVLKTQVEDERAGLKSRSLDCKNLCKLTDQVFAEDTFMSFPPKDPAAIAKELNELPAKNASIRSLIAIYEASFKDPRCHREALFNEARHDGEDAVDHLVQLQASVAKGADLAKKIQPWQTAIKAVRSDPTAFEETLEIGDFDQSNAVAIKVTAQSIDKPDKTAEILSTDIRFGSGPFFTLSGGLAYADASRPQFKPIQGFERTRDGKLVQPETATRVIGTSEAAAQVTPLLLLNGRLCTIDRWNASVHLSLGISAKNDDKGTDIEYLVGPSISFLDDQLLITVGAYGWRRPALQGDQYVGQKIAESVTELSVTKKTAWKIGFGLSYKIR